MGLLDEAATKRTADEDARAVRQLEIEARRRETYVAERSEYWRVTVVVDAVLPVTGLKQLHGRDSFGSRMSNWEPVEVTLQTYLVDGEIRICEGSTAVHGASGGTGLVRRCETCRERWAFTHLRAGSGREGLISALATKGAGAAECSFCASVREHSTCPTCHRGWE